MCPGSTWKLLESQLPFIPLVSKSWPEDVDEAILEEVGASPPSADGTSSPTGSALWGNRPHCHPLWIEHLCQQPDQHHLVQQVQRAREHLGDFSPAVLRLKQCLHLLCQLLISRTLCYWICALSPERWGIGKCRCLLHCPCSAWGYSGLGWRALLQAIAAHEPHLCCLWIALLPRICRWQWTETQEHPHSQYHPWAAAWLWAAFPTAILPAPW